MRGFQFGPATLLGHSLEPGIQDCGWRIVGVFLAATRHLLPEFAGLPFVLDPGPVFCRDDCLPAQFGRLDREQLADPANERMQAWFAEPDILVVAGDRRQSFNVSVVPTRALN